VVPARSRPQFGTAQRSVAAHAAPAREPDATAALPDVLAGLDVERPDGGARTVAVEPRNSTFPER
ncbi:MAG: hypothetical protein IAI50_04960, partial [Candidatus Eremiobacteraeota bacterium]|nr:hypothetical protein [Candidatus Eremiobacteraeota bacterium]